jgi:hypothetical protein
MLPVLLALAVTLGAKAQNMPARLQVNPAPMVVALNPQPLPPGLYDPWRMFVNPQPLPPHSVVDAG